jgi:hypothetical protein
MVPSAMPREPAKLAFTSRRARPITFVLVSIDAVIGSLGVLIILVKVIYISCQGDLGTRSLQYLYKS